MTKNYTGEEFVHLPVPMSMFAAVCALLGGASTSAIATSTANPSTSSIPAGGTTGDGPQATALKAAGEPAAAAAASDAGSADAGEVDAEGWPWSADLHAGTKGKTKAGLWRMKVGATRPDPKPGFSKVGGGDDAADASGSTPTPTPTPAPAVEDEDEFAAFRAAADASSAPAAAPARTWTDADLGALCNQAAAKLGDPAPVKAIIAEHVPQGTVPHSRNIPDDKRAAFAAAVEAKAGITFAAS